MGREKISSEIDFDYEGGNAVETISSKVSAISQRLYAFKNPYIGNKRKLINNIIMLIDKYGIKYNSVLDLFSGSSFVSMAMKLLNKQVISNDILTCSYFNAVAFVKNKNIYLTDEEKKSLFVYNDEKDINHIIDLKYTNRFSLTEIDCIENYFTNIEKLWGDILKENIKAVLATVYMQNYILKNCFVGGRLNNGQVLSSYSHRIDHKRNKGNELFSSIKSSVCRRIDWTKPIYPDDPNQHQCYNMDAVELLQKIRPIADLCYIDPPYGGDQSDYGYMYSFFEELIHKCPYNDILIYRKGYNNFVSKHNYIEHFEELIKEVAYIPNLIISYNNNSWGDINEICDVIKKYRTHIDVEEFNYSYNYRNRFKNKLSKEYLIIVRE